MDNLKIVDQSVTPVDYVEEKLIDYFRKNKIRPGDAIPKETELSESEKAALNQELTAAGFFKNINLGS